MPIYAKAGASFTPAPSGTHLAVCCDVVDLGMLETEWQGVKKKQHKIKIVWQIDEQRDDGKRFTVGRRYTNSLHEKATLRRDLESWRGRPFTETELQGFDLENLLNAGALLNVIHESRQGTVYANVASLMRVPKGMTAPTIEDYVRVCDRKDTESSPVQPAYDDQGITDDDVPF